MFQKKTPLQREWSDMRKREIRFLKKATGKKESFLNRQLEDKVPEKLQSTLNLAFEKAFVMIFENGTGLIEKTFRKGKLEERYQLNEFADTLSQSRKSIRSFSKQARSSGAKNLMISGTAGIGMGLLGVGIPDIAVLTAMMLKSIYEIAASYGYGYDDQKEKAFILMLIQGAVSCGTSAEEMDQKINACIMEETLLPVDDLETQIRKTSGLLSKELLYMKFLQGIPVAGVIGGAYDIVYMKQITEYANIKYQRRFLIQKKHIFEKNKER